MKFMFFSIKWFLLRFHEYPRPSDSTESAEAVPIDSEFVTAVVEPLVLLKYVPYISSSVNRISVKEMQVKFQ